MLYKMRGVMAKCMLAPILLSLLGCNEAKVPVFTNPTIDTFYANYSLDAPQAREYVIEGIFVAPYFVPNVGYSTFDLGISAFSKEKDKSVNVINIAIEKTDFVVTSDKHINAEEKHKESQLFRSDRIVVEGIDTDFLTTLVGDDEELIVRLEVSVNDKKYIINYPYFLKKKIIAAPIR